MSSSWAAVEKRKFVHAKVRPIGKYPPRCTGSRMRPRCSRESTLGHFLGMEVSSRAIDPCLWHRGEKAPQMALRAAIGDARGSLERVLAWKEPQRPRGEDLQAVGMSRKYVTIAGSFRARSSAVLVRCSRCGRRGAVRKLGSARRRWKSRFARWGPGSFVVPASASRERRYGSQMTYIVQPVVFVL